LDFDKVSSFDTLNHLLNLLAFARSNQQRNSAAFALMRETLTRVV
jgi:hypothetical protein